MSAVYDVSSLPTSAAWPYAWWCRGCGEYRPVDDLEHGRVCVPPPGTVLSRLLAEHLAAVTLLRATRASGRDDPERRYHVDVARATLGLRGRLLRDGR